MTNAELIETRKVLNRLTNHLENKIHDEQLPLFPEPISKLELMNFLDRANKVVHDIERMIRVD